MGIGIWLLAAPTLLGLTGGARLSHLVVGPIAASAALIALWPATRLVSRANIVLGAWLVVAPLLTEHQAWWLESSLCGAGLAVLALVPRGQGHRFGGGWRALVDSRSPSGRTDKR